MSEKRKDLLIDAGHYLLGVVLGTLALIIGLNV